MHVCKAENGPGKLDTKFRLFLAQTEPAFDYRLRTRAAPLTQKSTMPICDGMEELELSHRALRLALAARRPRDSAAASKRAKLICAVIIGITASGAS